MDQRGLAPQQLQGLEGQFKRELTQEGKELEGESGNEADDGSWGQSNCSLGKAILEVVIRIPPSPFWSQEPMEGPEEQGIVPLVDIADVTKIVTAPQMEEPKPVRK